MIVEIIRDQNAAFWASSKSRRDDLFIEWQIPYPWVLFVFQRRGPARFDKSRRNCRAAEKQKEKSLARSVNYKQVIPTGFKSSTLQGPRSLSARTAREMWVMVSLARRPGVRGPLSPND